MKPVLTTLVTLCLVVSSLQSLADQYQQVNECPKHSSLVYQEKGDVTVSVLLDLTQGPQCSQKNPASMQSMSGILQTFQTLNSIQYLKGLKIGIRISDTCSQENVALQAVLESAVEANLTHSFSCRGGSHLGFLFPVRSYPSAVQLLSVLNLPATDISYWQTTSPLDAVSDLLVRLRWTSIAVISQSKQALLSFSKKASERSICIVAQTVLSPINRTKEMTIRAVRRSKRSGSKVYVLIGSSEFLLTILPHFQTNSTTGSSSKYVLVAADNWNSNFSEEVGQIVDEALIIRPQRVLTDDNVSARVLYSLIKQYKNHLATTCSGKVNACDFEPHHLIKKTILAEEDLRILKLSTDISIYNELFPVSYVSKKTAKGSQTIVDIGNIHEDKFIPTGNLKIDREEISECTDCLCTNVESTPTTFVLQLRYELHFIITGSISILGVLLTLIGFIILLRIQCCSSHEDKSGNFLFLLLLAVLILFLVSFLYILVPSSILCLSRVIALSGGYTIFLATIISTAATSLMGNRPDDKTARLCAQSLIFALAVGVQVPVLIYETLLRDDTLLINKVLTDYGPKTECTLDDILSLKLFIYPVVLLAIVNFGSIAVICHHWHVSAIKINLGVSSLVCSMINVAWGVCYFQLGKEWRDVVILAGIQGNGFIMLFGVVLPKIITGLQNLHHSYLTKPWQDVGSSGNHDDEASHSSLPQPPARPHQQHIYAIPSEYDRRSAGSEYNNHSTVM